VPIFVLMTTAGVPPFQVKRVAASYVVSPQIVVNHLEAPNEFAVESARATTEFAHLLRQYEFRRNNLGWRYRWNKYESCSRSTKGLTSVTGTRVRIGGVGPRNGSRSNVVLPVRASKARTMPRPTSTFQLSAMEETDDDQILAMAGADT